MKSPRYAVATSCLAIAGLLCSESAFASDDHAHSGSAIESASNVNAKAVHAWACFDGSALPNSIVAEVGFPGNGQTLKMRCGDPTKGVVHVDFEGHEITEQNAAAFQNCLSDTMFFGRWHREGSNPNYSVWRWDFGPNPGDAAEFVYQNSDGEGVTFYTTGIAPGNEWERCASAR